MSKAKTKTMECIECGSPMRSKRVTVPLGDLPGVTVENATLWTCTNCDETITDMGKLAAMMDRLAAELADKQGRLSKEEFRFLRSWLGYSSEDFANTIGVRPETVSRWEKGKIEILLVNEMALRYMVKRGREHREYPTPASRPKPMRMKFDAATFQANA